MKIGISLTSAYKTHDPRVGARWMKSALAPPVESAEHLASRHSEKVRQLQANPFGKDGYVFVCCFSNQQAKLSFHQAESA